MIRLFVTDDHIVVRRGIIQIISEVSDINLVGEAGSGQETLRGLRETKPDVLLLDISLPDINGVELLKQIVSWHPELRVLMLSVYPEAQYAMRSLQAGAFGYLTKNSVPDELVDAIRKISRGEQYITPFLAEKLVAHYRGISPGDDFNILSDREYEVLRMLSSGKSITEAAAQLSISTKSISTYRARILKKLGLSNTAQMIHYGISHGLVDQGQMDPRKDQ